MLKACQRQFLLQALCAVLIKSGAEAFLERGDKVAATARDLNHLADLVAKYGNNVLPNWIDLDSKASRRFLDLQLLTGFAKAINFNY